jgi:hypothetical protein
MGCVHLALNNGEAAQRQQLISKTAAPVFRHSLFGAAMNFTLIDDK